MRGRILRNRSVHRLRRRLATASDRPRYWFHVTYNGRLSQIADHGLRRGSSRAIGAPAYDGHAAKGVFLTDADGVSFWHSRAEAFAEHNSDNVVEDEMIPVVLRVRARATGGSMVDAEGTRDALADAVIYTGPVIPPNNIEIWTGSRWIPIDRYDEVNFSQGVHAEVDPDSDSDPDSDDEDEPSFDGESNLLYYFVDASPLLPTDDEFQRATWSRR